MEKFRVNATANINFELMAENEDQAREMIKQAFKSDAAYDPLAETAFYISKTIVRFKTTVIDENEIVEVENIS